jgi:hypothetical protein
MKDKMNEGAPLGNTNAVQHGIYSFENNVNRGLQPLEIDSLQELRELVHTGDGRQSIREEITARLTIIVRKVFDDLAAKKDSPAFWNEGVTTRGGTYLAELRRWLDTFPVEKQNDYHEGKEIIQSYRDRLKPPIESEENNADASDN